MYLRTTNQEWIIPGVILQVWLRKPKRFCVQTHHPWLRPTCPTVGGFPGHRSTALCFVFPKRQLFAAMYSLDLEIDGYKSVVSIEKTQETKEHHSMHPTLLVLYAPALVSFILEASKTMKFPNLCSDSSSYARSHVIRLAVSRQIDFGDLRGSIRSSRWSKPA